MVLQNIVMVKNVFLIPHEFGKKYISGFLCAVHGAFCHCVTHVIPHRRNTEETETKDEFFFLAFLYWFQSPKSAARPR